MWFHFLVVTDNDQTMPQSKNWLGNNQCYEDYRREQKIIEENINEMEIKCFGFAASERELK